MLNKASHNLKVLFAGTIPKDLHVPFETRFKVPLREGYGMMEIGPGITMSLEKGEMIGSGSVGTASEYRQLKTVDEEGVEVADGVTGKLWITGAGLFKGYYNKLEVTAEAFDGDWFKSGDLFRRDERGYYYVVCRKKEMLKRSGDNIAAVEIEEMLLAHPKIASAAVVPDPDRKEEVKA